jgi:G3E family GTPase
MGLPNGITSAQAAGIDLDLGYNKIKDLIDKSAEARDDTNREYNIEIQLGKRIEYVNIVREKDCTSVKPKAWIDKSVWREINDILAINGFAWLQSGKESEWIRIKQQRSTTKEELAEHKDEELLAGVQYKYKAKFNYA